MADQPFKYKDNIEIDEDLLNEIIRDYVEVKKEKPISWKETGKSLLQLFDPDYQQELALSAAYDQIKNPEDQKLFLERVKKVKKDYPYFAGGSKQKAKGLNPFRDPKEGELIIKQGAIDLENIKKDAGVQRYDIQDDYLDLTKEAEKVFVNAFQKTLYNVADAGTLAADPIINLAGGVGSFLLGGTGLKTNSDLNKKLDEAYEQIKFERSPETFVGTISEILLQYAVPWRVASVVLKNITKLPLLGKGIKKLQEGGIKLLDKVDDKFADRFGIGKVNAGVKIPKKVPYIGGRTIVKQGATNIFRRMGKFGAMAGTADFLIGGNEAPSPFFLNEKLIDTSDLSGPDLAIAKIKNRFLYMGDGFMLGNGIVLAGPAAGLTLKGGLKATGAGLDFIGKGMKTWKEGYGMIIPDAVAKKSQAALRNTAKGVSKLGGFLGKEVLTRAGIATVGNPIFTFKNPSLLIKKIPDYKNWKMSYIEDPNNPLFIRLKTLDKFLSGLRTRGNLTKEAAKLTLDAKKTIQSLTGGVQRTIDALDDAVYDLVKDLRKVYDKKPGSPALHENINELIEQYLLGQSKLSSLDPLIQREAQLLKVKLGKIFKTYEKVFNTEAVVKDTASLIRKYYTKSFKAFTNENYALGVGDKFFDDAVEEVIKIIKKDDLMTLGAIKNSPNLSKEESIKRSAQMYINEFLQAGKAGEQNPLEIIRFFAGPKKLKLFETKEEATKAIKTGAELPPIFKKVLGEENNYQFSSLLATADLVNKSVNKEYFNELARQGLKNGWLFKNTDDGLSASDNAFSAGIFTKNQAPITSNSLDDVLGDARNLVGEKNVVEAILGTRSKFDMQLLIKIPGWKKMLELKSAAQMGKTVLSPGTQIRNVTSASMFAMANGHFGGHSHFYDAVKMTLDDVFGAGNSTNLAELIKRLERQIEVGAIDDNIIVSELAAILDDIRKGKVTTSDTLFEKLTNARWLKTATKIYGGGDNMWKSQGYEYTRSELSTFMNSIDDVKSWHKEIGQIEFNPNSLRTGQPKTVEEAIEEISGWYIQNLYPTYSKVPKVIKDLRVLPLGNFIAFPAEMMRTTTNLLGTSIREMSSSIPTLQKMGLKRAVGASFVLGGLESIIKGVYNNAAEFDDRSMRLYKKYFSKPWEVNSNMAVVTIPKDGVWKMLNLSYTTPYGMFTNAFTSTLDIFTKTKTKDLINPFNGEDFLLYQLFDKEGPVNKMLEIFYAEPIGYEAFIDIITRKGKTAEGKSIYSETDSDGDRVIKMMTHIMKTLEPGAVTQARGIENAATGNIRADGRFYNLFDEMLAVFGGVRFSDANVLTVFDFELARFGRLRSDVYKTEYFYSLVDYAEKAPNVRADQFSRIQEEFFREQEELYHMVQAALDLGVPADPLEEKLRKRLGNSLIDNIMDGVFTPLKYSPDALESAYEKFKDSYYYENIDKILIEEGLTKGTKIYRDRYKEIRETLPRPQESFFVPESEFDRVIDFWEDKKFAPLSDEFGEIERKERLGYEQKQKDKKIRQEDRKLQESLKNSSSSLNQEIQTPPLNTTTENPTVSVASAAPNVNPTTNLTKTEEALLSPTDKIIRQNQRTV